MDKELIGKIIALASNIQVIINIGKRDGVEEGMIFGIKLILPEIVDPDDKSNILSGIFFEKGEIKIVRVFERMSFASIIPKKAYSTPVLSDQFFAQKYEYPKLSGQIILSEDQWHIKKGDEVFYKKSEKAITK